MENKKLLVVFYSRTGTTKEIAEAICERFQCDIDEILTTDNRKGFLGYMKCGREAMQKILPVLKQSGKNSEMYEAVIIGTPVWAGTMSSPIRTYLTENRERVKQAAFFYVSGGPNNTKVFQEMADVLGKKPIATLDVRREDVKKKAYSEKVEGFVDEIKERE
jgi:flavodoxin